VTAVAQVALEAKAELAQKHPGLNLKHDPTANLPVQGGRRRVSTKVMRPLKRNTRKCRPAEKLR